MCNKKTRQAQIRTSLPLLFYPTAEMPRPAVFPCCMACLALLGLATAIKQHHTESAG